MVPCAHGSLLDKLTPVLQILIEYIAKEVVLLALVANLIETLVLDGAATARATRRLGRDIPLLDALPAKSVLASELQGATHTLVAHCALHGSRKVLVCPRLFKPCVFWRHFFGHTQ